MFNWIKSLFVRDAVVINVKVELSEPLKVVICNEQTTEGKNKEYRSEPQNKDGGYPKNISTTSPDEDTLDSFKDKLSGIKGSKVKFGTDT